MATGLAWKSLAETARARIELNFLTILLSCLFFFVYSVDGSWSYPDLNGPEPTLCLAFWGQMEIVTGLIHRMDSCQSLKDDGSWNHVSDSGWLERKPMPATFKTYKTLTALLALSWMCREVNELVQFQPVITFFMKGVHFSVVYNFCSRTSHHFLAYLVDLDFSVLTSVPSGLSVPFGLQGRHGALPPTHPEWYAGRDLRDLKADWNRKSRGAWCLPREFSFIGF